LAGIAGGIAGYGYDMPGRPTTIPSAQTINNAGNLTATYHTNDLV
jgi:hypothetical protein